MAIDINPEYEGPDRDTFITLVDPTKAEVASIPEGCDLLVRMPNNALSEWWWSPELRNDMLKHFDDGGDLRGHILIYVNPEIIKEGH